MVGYIGIDTVVLKTEEFKIGEVTKLRRVVHNYREKFIYNDEYINLTILTKDKFLNDISLLIIKFSFSKIKNQTNFGEIKACDVLPVYENLKYKLQDIGVDTELGESKITRLDVYKDIGFSGDEQKINYLCNNLYLKYQSRHTGHRRFGENCTNYFQNKSKCLVIYNKSKEMNCYRENEMYILRFEFRAYNKKAVERYFGIKTFYDLHNCFVNISQCFYKVISGVFRYELTDFKSFWMKYLSESAKLKDIIYYYGEKSFENRKNWFRLGKYNSNKKSIGYLNKIIAGNRRLNLNRMEISMSIDQIIKYGGNQYFSKIMKFYGIEYLSQNNTFGYIEDILGNEGNKYMRSRIKALRNIIALSRLLNCHELYLNIKESLLK